MVVIKKNTIWFDYDLTSAYTTAMTALGNPDYNLSKYITLNELDKMTSKDIIFSYILIKGKFKFPQTVKYPSIPCFVDEHTTVYPLEGKAFLTGAEYILAKSQDCDFVIDEIYFLPFEKDKDKNLINQPFKELIVKIQEKRLEHPKGTIHNMLYKEIGNSIYGNVVRGMSDKRKFDIKSGKNLRLDASDLSNPIIASWITAFIRSVIGECLHNIFLLNGKIISVTTDGFVSNVEDLEIKLKKLKNIDLISIFKNLRFSINKNDSALEIKNVVSGIKSWTTRGIFTTNAKIKATTGFQSVFYDPKELDDFLKISFATKEKAFEYTQNTLRSAKDLIVEGGHVTKILKDQIFRLHFDNRRIIIVPKEFENSIDFSKILLDSKPLPNITKAKNLRGIVNLHKNTVYQKQSNFSKNSRYKNYKEISIRNFIKGLLATPSKYNLNKKDFIDYNSIIHFIKEYDPNFKINKKTISK